MNMDKVDKMNETDETSLSLWTPVLINNKPPQLCFEAQLNRKRFENHVNKFYRTEPIDIRLGENLVRLKNGEMCRLIGDLYDPKACVPYDVKIKFRRGIPDNWSDVVHAWAKMLETDHSEILALSNYSQKKRLWIILKSLGLLKVSAKGRIIFPTWKYCTGDEEKINNLLCNPATVNICIPKLINRLEKELLIKSGSKDLLSKNSSNKTRVFDSNQPSERSINMQPIPDNSRVANLQISSESNLRRTRRINPNNLEKDLNIREKDLNIREKDLNTSLYTCPKMKPYCDSTIKPKNSYCIENMKYPSRSISPRKKTHSHINRREKSPCSDNSVARTIETRTSKCSRRELRSLNTGCKVLNSVHKSRTKQVNNPKCSNPKNKSFMVKSTAKDSELSKSKIESTGLQQLHHATKNKIELMKSAKSIATRRSDDEIKQHVPQNLQSEFRGRKKNQLLRFSKPITKENNGKNGENRSNVKKVTDFTSRKASKYTPYQLRKCDTKMSSSLGSRLYQDRRSGRNLESKRQIQRNDSLSGDRKVKERTSIQMTKLKMNKISRLQDRVKNKVTSHKIQNSNSSASPLKKKIKGDVPTVLPDRDEGRIDSKMNVQLSHSKKKRTLDVVEKEIVDLSAGLFGPPKTLSDRKKLRQSINSLSSSFIEPVDLFSDPNYHHLIEDVENESNQEWDSDYLIALEQIKNGSQGDQLSVGSVTPPQKYIIDTIINEPQIIRGTSPFENSSPNQEEVVRYIHRQMKMKNKLSKERNARTKLCSLQLPSLEDQKAQELSEMTYNAMLSGKSMPRKLFDFTCRRRSDSDSSDSSDFSEC